MRSCLAKSLIASVVWTGLSIWGVVHYHDFDGLVESAARNGESFAYDRLFERARVLKSICAVSAGIGVSGMVTCLIAWALRRQDNPTAPVKRGFDVVMRKGK